MYQLHGTSHDMSTFGSVARKRPAPFSCTIAPFTGWPAWRTASPPKLYPSAGRVWYQYAVKSTIGSIAGP